MNWHKYYQTPLTLEELLRNLYGQRDFLVEIVGLGPRKILEIGTGTGGMSIFLSWLGFDVTGVDVDSQIVDWAKSAATKLNSSAKFEIADGFKLPYEDNSFDLVFHQGLLEHFSNEEVHRLLSEQLRVAHRVVISVPNHWYPRRDFGNERLLDKNSWEKILSPFRITQSRYYSLKRFPRPWLWRKPIQYLAVIEKNE